MSNYDIPKLYLRSTKKIGNFDYEVADGQQRLQALWKFLDGKYVLQGMSDNLSELNGVAYEDLADSHRKQIDNYVFTITVVNDADADEIRELFRRLQLGVRLNPAELRNSMASALGNEIRAMALTHPFFPKSPFSLARYKADDLTAHAFAVLIYERRRDIKAPDLRNMYVEYSKAIEPHYAARVNQVLHFMEKMVMAEPKCIQTKWGFVDMFGVLVERKLSTLSVMKVIEAYVEWERDRSQLGDDLPALAAAGAGSRKRMLFDYISAFQKEGATKRSLEARFKILNSVIPK